jgi:hypothetical protein
MGLVAFSISHEIPMPCRRENRSELLEAAGPRITTQRRSAQRAKGADGEVI